MARLHAKGIAVIGGTVTPFGGSFLDTPERRATRQAVNAFVRTSRLFNGFVDFDRAIRRRSRRWSSSDSQRYIAP